MEQAPSTFAPWEQPRRVAPVSMTCPNQIEGALYL